ncbi:MAG: hypothetical protein BWY31_00248 [Lentisphaerae bacterium ADurb.Bin242]|nr:MAG: hypothetical protein BWY31_00248 [Lentisphaerae bacterium ADurb.Bin242]
MVLLLEFLLFRFGWKQYRADKRTGGMIWMAVAVLFLPLGVISAFFGDIFFLFPLGLIWLAVNKIPDGRLTKVILVLLILLSVVGSFLILRSAELFLKEAKTDTDALVDNIILILERGKISELAKRLEKDTDNHILHAGLKRFRALSADVVKQTEGK